MTNNGQIGEKYEIIHSGISITSDSLNINETAHRQDCLLLIAKNKEKILNAEEKNERSHTKEKCYD